MDVVEHEKLEWMRDLPPPSAGDSQVQGLGKLAVKYGCTYLTNKDIFSGLYLSKQKT